MNIIEVIPIAKGIGKETLTYFTSAELREGSIVEVPLRSKKIHALVVRVKPAEEMKTDIKSAGYAIKKVDAVKTADLFTPEFIRAAEETARYFAATVGSVLNPLVPKVILGEKNSNSSASPEIRLRKTPERFVIQGEDEERFSSYRSHIRQQFAQKQSVLFCVPTIEDAKRAQKLLCKGIEDYTFMLHGGLKEKEVAALWKKVTSESHAIVIIATSAFLSIARSDLGSIIIERENSRHYKLGVRPYFDIRFFIERYATHRGARLLLGDSMVRTETLWREEEGELVQGTPFKFRSLSTSQDKLVDMRSYKTPGGSFKIASDEVESLIKETKNHNTRLFILTTRRGLAPMTLCADCQNIVRCLHCSAPVVLHSSTKDGQESNYFLCHHCGERRSAEEVCVVCGSWKLATVGIGIELVYKKISERFPDMKVIRIDSDSTTTEKQLLAKIDDFYNSPGSILIGTEMALSYLHEKIENAAVISIDSLFSMPDFRIHEKIIYTLLKIRSLTSGSLIIQTRNPDEKVLDYALKGNLIEFYRDEIEVRRQLGYPPFKVLIKLTLEGAREAIIKEMESIHALLEPYEADVFPAFTHTVRGKFVLHALIKVEPSQWPDSVLLEKLYALPPSVTIKVDPESLL